MKGIPRQLIEGLTSEHLMCPHCNVAFDINGINAIGVRNSMQNAKKEVLFIEYECFKCDEKTMLEMGEMNLEQFADFIMEDIADEASEEIHKEIEKKTPKPDDEPKLKAKKRSDNPKPPIPRRSLSKITQAEVKSYTKLLKDTESFGDFLKRIGINPGQVFQPKLSDEDCD